MPPCVWQEPPASQRLAFIHGVNLADPVAARVVDDLARALGVAGRTGQQLDLLAGRLGGPLALAQLVLLGVRIAHDKRAYAVWLKNVPRELSQVGIASNTRRVLGAANSTLSGGGAGEVKPDLRGVPRMDSPALEEEQRHQRTWEEFLRAHPDAGADIRRVIADTGITGADVMRHAMERNIPPVEAARRLVDGGMFFDGVPPRIIDARNAVTASSGFPPGGVMFTRGETSMPGQLRIARRDVSAPHAHVQTDGSGGYTIRDLGSSQGTLLNGRNIRGLGPVPLQPFDEVVLGRPGVAGFRFVFVPTAVQASLAGNPWMDQRRFPTLASLDAAASKEATGAPGKSGRAPADAVRAIAAARLVRFRQALLAAGRFEAVRADFLQPSLSGTAVYPSRGLFYGLKGKLAGKPPRDAHAIVHARVDALVAEGRLRLIGAGQSARVYLDTRDGSVYRVGAIYRSELQAARRMGRVGIGPAVEEGRELFVPSAHGADAPGFGVMSMALLDGGTLAKAYGDGRLRQPLTPVLRLLGRMHATTKTVHGDVHDQNLMVGVDGAVRAIDFGAAQKAGANAARYADDILLAARELRDMGEERRLGGRAAFFAAMRRAYFSGVREFEESRRPQGNPLDARVWRAMDEAFNMVEREWKPARRAR